MLESNLSQLPHLHPSRCGLSSPLHSMALSTSPIHHENNLNTSQPPLGLDEYNRNATKDLKTKGQEKNTTFLFLYTIIKNNLNTSHTLLGLHGKRTNNRTILMLSSTPYPDYFFRINNPLDKMYKKHHPVTPISILS